MRQASADSITQSANLTSDKQDMKRFSSFTWSLQFLVCFLADGRPTNGRAYATVLRPSVVGNVNQSIL